MPNYQHFFEDFMRGLEIWSQTGKEPNEGNQNIRFFLDLQEKRLKQHNLKMDITLTPKGGLIPVGKVQDSSPILSKWNICQMNQTLYAEVVDEKTAYSRNGEILKCSNGTRSFYATIIDPIPGQTGLEDSAYVCPNCGSISTIRVLRDQGCPFCKTRFLMDELYPKVANFYELNSSPADPDRIRRYIKNICIASVIGGSVFTLMGMLAMRPSFNFFLIFVVLSQFAIMAGSIFIPMYIGLSLYCLFSLIRQAHKSIVVISGSSATRKKIASVLKPLDPAFDYGYFEGKAITLARILMLSDNPESFIQYEGPAIGSRFADVVDVQYRGGFRVNRIDRKNEKITLTLDLFLTLTRINKGRLRVRDRKVRLQMYHYESFPVDTDFSVVKVQCSSCAASFDARSQNTCPYCGQKYDAGRNDWIVTQII